MTAQITWVPRIQGNDSTPGFIRHMPYDQIDKFDFENNSFFEYLINLDRVHPYFDFDDVKTLEQYKSVLDWLRLLKASLGNYAIGGYTSKEDIAEYSDLKYIKNAHHIASFHVVFYEVSVSAKLLMEVMKAKNKEFLATNVHELADSNVYKLETKQKFRHPLSNKVFAPGDNKNCETRGSIVDDHPPSHLIVQIRGDEKDVDDILPKVFGAEHVLNKQTTAKGVSGIRNSIIRENLEKARAKQSKKEIAKSIVGNDDYADLYDAPPSEPSKPSKPSEPQEPTKRSHHKKAETIQDLEITDELIKFTREEMLELLSHFDNCCNTILTTLAPLYQSPYSKDWLIDVVSEWYEEVEHAHPENVQNFIDRYYKQEDTNRWFFCLIGNLDEDTRKEYKDKYFNHIDYSININNTKMTYDDIKHKTYSRQGLFSLINDMRAVLGNIDDKWYLKVLVEDQPYIKIMKDSELMTFFKTFKPFRNNNSINLYQVVSKFSNYFRYYSAKMTKDNIDGVINTFQGFKYEEIETDDFTILEPFLKHIENIVCAGDKDKYNYFMCWFANIFQNVTVKNGTFPIVHGDQGSGKSFPIEVFCNLIGIYAVENIDDLDKVFGKFNILISNHILININEPPDANDKFKFTGKIKSKTTQVKTILETKGIDQANIESWANYSMTTNNWNPVVSEVGDRRLIFFGTDNSQCGEETYFNELCKPIQPVRQGPYNKEFMGILLHYMRTQIDLSDFNPERLIRAINSRTDVDYNESLDRQYNNMSKIHLLICDKYKAFIKGITSEEIEERFGKVDGYTTKGIFSKVREVCNATRVRVNGRRLYSYKLKPMKQIKGFWNIIRYQHHDEDDFEQVCKEYLESA